MKKLLFILLSVILFSCVEEEVTKPIEITETTEIEKKVEKEGSSDLEIELMVLRSEIDSLEQVKAYHYDDIIILLNERHEEGLTQEQINEIEYNLTRVGNKKDSIETIIRKKRRERTKLNIMIERESNKNNY